MIFYTFNNIGIMPDICNPGRGRYWVGEPCRILAYCETREEAEKVLGELRDMVLRNGQAFTGDKEQG